MTCFRKPWLRMKLVNFDFSAKSSSTDYNESISNPEIPPPHTGSEKSLVELGIPKNGFFHVFVTGKFTFHLEPRIV